MSINKILTTAAYPARCGAYVYHNATIAVGAAAWVALSMNSEVSDTASFHSTSTNNSRITIPTGYDGLYAIGGYARFDASSGVTTPGLAIKLNNSTMLTRQVPYTGADTGLNSSFNLAITYPLVAGDYVELCAYHNSGANRNINADTAGANNPYGPHLYVWRVGQ